MKSYSITDYLKAGCPELERPDMMAVHGLTGGRVCDTGCWAFNGGGCAAYKKLTSLGLGSPHKNPNQHKETVRAEAKRRGLSINEVRRQRRDASYNQNAICGE